MKVRIFDNMDQCTQQVVEQLLPLVNNQRREQALRYKHTFGQFCCLQSWIMLRDLLGHAPTEWSYNENGKPFLAGEDKALYFSISHCKSAIVVAVADEPIGIDVESIRKVDDSLIERTMNEQEQHYIRAAKQPQRAFTALWTKKEAILKWIGTGINSFDQLKTITERHNPKPNRNIKIETIEAEKYIYTIIYGKLHSFGT